MNLYYKLKSFTIKFDYVISLKYMYVLSQKFLHMMWNQGLWIFRICWVLSDKFKYLFICVLWLYFVDGCLIYVDVNRTCYVPR